MEWQPWQRRQFPGATARLSPPATAFPQWYTPFARQQRATEEEARQNGAEWWERQNPFPTMQERLEQWQVENPRPFVPCAISANEIRMSREMNSALRSNFTDTDVLFVHNVQALFDASLSPTRRMLGFTRALNNEQLLTALHIMRNHTGEDAMRALNRAGFNSHYVRAWSEYAGPADLIIRSYEAARQGRNLGDELTRVQMDELRSSVNSLLGIARGHAPGIPQDVIKLIDNIEKVEYYGPRLFR